MLSADKNSRKHMKIMGKKLYLLAVSWLFLVTTFATCRADITLDGSLGRPGGALQTTSGGEYTIRADMGKQVGSNLFHSFGVFNIDAGQTANFTGGGAAGPVHNILSRVTAGQPSSIDGLLKTSFANDQPNLFFMNPAGVIFGPNASLDVQGSFHVTTADYLKLADGVRFDAQPSGNDALLSVAPVGAFGFLGGRPKGISFLGSGSATGEQLFGFKLSVPRGQSFSLIGGDITVTNYLLSNGSSVESRLYAPEGYLNIISVGSKGEVLYKGNTVDISSFEKLGNLTLSGKSQLDVSSRNAASGSIFIRSGQFVMDNGFIFADTFKGKGGGIDIDVQENLIIRNASQLGTAVRGDSGGVKGGDVNLRSKNLYMKDGAQIYTNTDRLGDAGSMSIMVDDELNVDGNNLSVPTAIITQTLPGSSGNSGDFIIKTGAINVKGNARIGTETYGSGNAGNINVNADIIKMTEGARLFSETRKNSTGNGGDVEIAVSDTLDMHGEAQISASTFSSGKGGKLTVSASTISVSGNDKNNLEAATGIYAVVAGNNSGNAGDLTINASKFLTLSGDAQISTNTHGEGNSGNLTIHAGQLVANDGAQISAGTYSSGNGGNLEITANDITLSGENTLLSGNAARGSTGSGGNIWIKANNNLNIFNGANIFSSTFGSGAGGVLTINAKDILIDGAGSERWSTSIQSETRFGNGNANNLTINADNNLYVRNGAVISSSTFTSGHGGKLTISAQNIDVNGDYALITTQATKESSGTAGDLELTARGKLQLQNDGVIDASTFGSGHGGNLTISANDILLNGNGSKIFNGIVTRTYGKGNAGNLTITALNKLQQFLDSEISTSTRFSSGNGGTLRINAQDIELNGENGRHNDISSSSDDGSTGRAGDLHVISQGILLVRNGARIDAGTFGTKQGGDIYIQAKDIVLENSGKILSESYFSGVAGSIILKALGNLRLVNDSHISVATAQTNAGSISLNIGKLLLLSNNSAISTSAAVANNQGTGNGGNIIITKPAITVLNDSSKIVAQAKRGSGGNITLATDYLFKSPDSLISASSEFGQSGTVNVNTPDSQIINSTLKLSDKLLNASSLLSERCAARAYQDKKSSLQVKIHSLRPGPEEWGNSRLAPASRSTRKLSLKNANISLSWPPLNEHTLTASLDCRWQIAKH